MKACIKCPIIIILLFSFISCNNSEKFEFLRYETGGFGSPSYTLKIRKDKSFEIDIQHDPFNEVIDSSKIGKFYGNISEKEMTEIQQSIYKISRKGYDYNNPEFVLDAGNYELYIEGKNSEKVFQTRHATENFQEDIIEPFQKIAENQVNFKLE